VYVYKLPHGKHLRRTIGEDQRINTEQKCQILVAGIFRALSKGVTSCGVSIGIFDRESHWCLSTFAFVFLFLIDFEQVT
jgi:hypothetical protein